MVIIMVDEPTTSTDYEDDIVVEDGENYHSSNSNGLGIKEITLNQFNKCVIEGSKEMVNGGVQKKLVNGVMHEIQVPNQREIFTNSVIMMEIIIVSKMQKKERKELSVQNVEIDQQIATLQKEYNEEKNRLKSLDKSLQAKKQGVSPGEFIRNKDWYEMDKVDLYRCKLALISKLLDAENYFEEGIAMAMG